MWFRVVFVCACSLLWGLTFWYAAHTSGNATIFGRYSAPYFAIVAVLFAMASALTASLIRNRYEFLYERRHAIALVAASLAAALLLAESTVRLADPLGISYYEESKAYHLAKLADADLYYRHQPNLDTSYQGVSVKTNSIGLRNREIGAKAADEFRILFLGDSITFGWGVEIEYTFSQIVSDRLNALSGLAVTTINSGVGSYNTRSEFEFLRRHGGALQPDAVFLLYVANDVEGTPKEPFDPWSRESIQGKSPPEVTQMLLGEFWLYRLVNHIGRYFEGGELLRVDTQSAGWRESVNALVGISGYCAERDIPLVVFVYRARPGEPLDSIVDELLPLADNEGFRLVDLQPAFAGRDMRLLSNSIVDSHPNAAGHAIIADTMVDFIRRNKLLAVAAGE